jgi:hypothetical protein
VKMALLVCRSGFLGILTDVQHRPLHFNNNRSFCMVRQRRERSPSSANPPGSRVNGELVTLSDIVVSKGGWRGVASGRVVGGSNSVILR